MSFTYTHTFVLIRKQTSKGDRDYPMWAPLRKYVHDKDENSAYFWCPQGHLGVLPNHEIDKEGLVTPSVVCPKPSCDFHSFVKLEDW